MKKIFKTWPDDTLGMEMRRLLFWGNFDHKFPMSTYAYNCIPLYNR